MAVKQQNKEFNLFEAATQISQEKAIDREAVFSIIREALVLAYKKKLNLETLETEDLESLPFKIDFLPDKNEIEVRILKKVVDSKTENPLEISLEDAKLENENVQIGETIEVKENPLTLTRIFSNQARQMIFQRLRDMEKDLLYKEYKAKEGELIHGYFQRMKKDIMSIDLGKVEGVMLRKDQNPGEKYRQGDRLKAIISGVELRPRDPIPFITLSRASGAFVSKLFEMEIPEVYDGIVEIRDVARIASIRTKVVVAATKPDIDPVGACVGMKGVRIQSIVRELGNERIDIIQYSDDPTILIGNAISPAKPVEVHANPSKKEALVVVNDDILSLAIGINGSNVKLASQVSGFKIDIKSVSQYNQELASPEARAKIEKLFSNEKPAAPQPKAAVEEDDSKTPLSEIPGFSSRIIGLLESGGIKNVETLIEYSTEDLAKVNGIGKSTAESILKILGESIEMVEE